MNATEVIEEFTEDIRSLRGFGSIGDTHTYVSFEGIRIHEYQHVLQEDVGRWTEAAIQNLNGDPSVCKPQTPNLQNELTKSKYVEALNEQLNAFSINSDIELHDESRPRRIQAKVLEQIVESLKQVYTNWGDCN